MSRRGPISAERVFFAARRVHGDRRSAFVAKVCRENAALRAQVEALLARGDAPSEFARPLTDLWPVAAEAPGTAAWDALSEVRRRRLGAPLGPGARIADRYLVEATMGEGSSGRVYRATDEVTRTVVAVKVLDLEAGDHVGQLQREAATLRWLRVPGVVRLQDDGVDGGRPFIVTDLVEGRPFPGEPASRRWDDVRDTAVGLLETLARIHALGVIHGDLKPANVLVDAGGIPTVLDVGIASGPSIDFGDSETRFAGTPSYMAPERIGGGPATVATDLYAVGVMLHQSLCGDVPHHAANRTEFLDRRRRQPATPIQTRLPDVPADAARMIDALLERDPAKRPPSAYDALDRLEHLRHARPGSPDHPWLGSRTLIDRLVETAREGASLDLWGPSGAGKTRTFEEAEKAVAALGRRTIRLVPAAEPYDSLRPVLGDPAGWFAATPEETQRLVEGRLATLLASGVVLVADPRDRLDRWSAEALDAARPAGTVWRSSRRAFPSAVAVPALRPIDLEPLFTGMNRIFHVPEDAALELHARARGLPGPALEEAASWVRAGLAIWVGDRIRIERSAIVQISATPWLRSVAASADAPTGPATGNSPEILALVAIRGRRATVEFLARALGKPFALVASLVEDLVSRGEIDRLDGGELTMSPGRASAAHATPETRRRLHRLAADALAPGDPDRVGHLIAAGADVEVAPESVAAARTLLRRGRTEAASAAAVEGFRFVRATTASDVTLGLAEIALTAALRLGTRSASENLIRVVARWSNAPNCCTRMAEIARAAIDAIDSNPLAALRRIEAIADRLPAELRLLAESVRVVAGRYATLDDEQAAVARASEWASHVDDPSVHRKVAGWVGWLRYRQGRFDDAAELHLRSAGERTAGNPSRGLAILHAAQAYIDAGRHANAKACARRGPRDRPGGAGAADGGAGASPRRGRDLSSGPRSTPRS